MPELLDYSGKRFGRLSVIHRAPTVRGETYWLCRCDCGNTKPIRQKTLKQGESKSCGCHRREVLKSLRKRFIQHGDSGSRKYSIWSQAKRQAKLYDINFAVRFEDLPAIPDYCPVSGVSLNIAEGYSRKNRSSNPSLAPIDPRKGYINGNVQFVSASAKRKMNLPDVMGYRHKITSLGKVRDLTGKSFGRLVVIERAPKRPRSHCTFWACICGCGNRTVVESSSLVRGHIRSCGCLARESAHIGNKKHGLAGSRLYRMLLGAKRRSRKAGIAFDLDTSKLPPVPLICPVLGIPINQDDHQGQGFDWNSPSFDRIHPDKGYTQDNVRIISNRANRLKCDGNVRELALIAADAMDIESIWPDLASEIRKRVQNF